jgi:hypothetical protein
VLRTVRWWSIFALECSLTVLNRVQHVKLFMTLTWTTVRFENATLEPRCLF